MTPESCKEVFARLSEYLDGELPPDLCDRIAQHIEGCGPCVEFVESLRKSVEMCRQIPVAERPAPMKAQVREELLTAYRAACGSRG
ncbi:MAG: zf-HC2 domain-containing protein [Bryobacteraceae bacterium]